MDGASKPRALRLLHVGVLVLCGYVHSQFILSPKVRMDGASKPRPLRLPHVDVLVLRGYVHSQFTLSPEGPGTVIRAALEADGRRQ
jgi:hypothetical protein